VLEDYVTAVEHSGLPEVWLRKRPRVERAGAAAAVLAPRLEAQGMVVVQRPDGAMPLESFVRSGVRLALASGRAGNPGATVAWATSAEQGGEALTREEAVVAGTLGAAYAEHSDREKGHLTVGALADLFVWSVDPFSASVEQLARARSILTIIGGRVVHDVP
jgi:predicted amidohydrolase YtcJ